MALRKLENKHFKENRFESCGIENPQLIINNVKITRYIISGANNTVQYCSAVDFLPIKARFTNLMSKK